MSYITDYVEPKLLVLAIVLYLIGEMIKSAKLVKTKYLPVVLGGIGIVLCGIWVGATYPMASYQNVFSAIFTALIQGVLVAGLAVYGNQIKKQLSKTDE